MKAFSSNGAAVFTGKRKGVAALFRKLEPCKTMINVHCICHCLALACADTGDDLLYVKDFETTPLQLWTFFKNSPKRLKIYVKVAMNIGHFDALSTRKKKRLIKSVKSAVRMRWLSLHASVDSLFEEYVGTLHALRSMKDDQAVGGAIAVGSLKKMDSVEFLGVLYMLKYMLPHLSVLSKTFQTGSLNFSRIVSSIKKTKYKIQDLAKKGTHLEQLRLDINGRLVACDISLSEGDEKLIETFGTQYAQAISKNIEERFPKEALDVLDAFSVFNAELVPSYTNSNTFSVYGNREIETLQNHYFSGNEKKAKALAIQWQDFRFERVQMRKRWFEFREAVESNKMKVKVLATEWTLQQIMQRFSGPASEYFLVTDIVKIAIVTPVTNAWPEQGASAIKRTKSCVRRRMKNDLLNGLLMLSINRPGYRSAAAQTVIENAAKCWISARRCKRPTIYRTIQEIPAKSVETQTVATVNIDVVEVNKKAGKMLAAIDHENQFSENWITNFHFDDEWFKRQY